MSQQTPSKLRLLLFEECNRSCSGCCNNQFDLKILPLVTSFFGYDEILLTGGEPLIYPKVVIRTIKWIRSENTTARIYLYTARVESHYGLTAIHEVLNYCDGLTVTIHNNNNWETQRDIASLMWLDSNISHLIMHHKKESNKSHRLNVFEGVDESFLKKIGGFWKVKKGIHWENPCSLPEGEVLMRLFPQHLERFLYNMEELR